MLLTQCILMQVYNPGGDNVQQARGCPWLTHMCGGGTMYLPPSLDTPVRGDEAALERI
jgi:hypothetical protein